MQLCSFPKNQKTNIISFFFFLNDTAPPKIYTLPIPPPFPISTPPAAIPFAVPAIFPPHQPKSFWHPCRSEEHTSELQSLTNLVCRLLLEKKKKHQKKKQES